MNGVVLSIVIGYLLGSCPFGYWAGRLRGVAPAWKVTWSGTWELRDSAATSNTEGSSLLRTAGDTWGTIQV